MGKKAKLQLNLGALLCQFLGTIFLIMSILVPNWLQNPSGLNYLPYPRLWGLWHVTSRYSRSLHDTWETACQIAATHAVDVVCVTPLCKWYEAKCSAYRIQYTVSLAVGILLILVIPFVIASVIFSLRKRYRAMKWTFGMAAITVIAPPVLLFTYLGFMSQSFDIINSTGYYPVPRPSLGVFLLATATFFFTAGLLFHLARNRKVRKEMEYEEDLFYDVSIMRQEYGM